MKRELMDPYAMRSNRPIMQVLLLKGCYGAMKNAGILGLRRKEIQSRARTRLDHLELLCNKVLLKYKRDRESF